MNRLSATQELRYIIFEKSPQQIKQLIDEGADVNEHFTDGDTPLHLLGNLFIAENAAVLLDNGADVNALNHEKCTPLHIAASRGDLQAISMFLNYGADIDMQNCAGDTPLHTAIYCFSQKAVQLLIERGARVDIKNDEGKTALNLLEENNWSFGQKIKRAQYLKLSGNEICEWLISQTGLDEARQVFKNDLTPLISRMGRKNALRAYVHIYRKLMPEEKQVYHQAMQAFNTVSQKAPRPLNDSRLKAGKESER